jgi:hypothetical protein
MSTTAWDREFDEQVGKEEGWLEEDKVETPFDSISPEIFGLLNLGRLSSKLEVRGHEVHLRTLTMDEELEIGLLISEFEGTQEWGRALATALVAASVDTLDGKPLVEALGPNENLLSRKYDYVRKHMYWPVIKIIYEEGYIPLSVEQQIAVDEFRKK